MSEQKNFFTQQRVATVVVLALALGPLAALTFGSKFADEETIARAEAGDRNYAEPDPLAVYQPPQPTGIPFAS